MRFIIDFGMLNNVESVWEALTIENLKNAINLQPFYINQIKIEQ